MKIKISGDKIPGGELVLETPFDISGSVGDLNLVAEIIGRELWLSPDDWACHTINGHDEESIKIAEAHRRKYQDGVIAHARRILADRAKDEGT